MEMWKWTKIEENLFFQNLSKSIIKPRYQEKNQFQDHRRLPVSIIGWKIVIF